MSGEVVAGGWKVPGSFDHPGSVADELTRLALEARDGDELALTGLIRRTQADVWRFVAHLVDQRSADDLTQEVYLRAVPALARFRGDAPVRSWLLAIARRVCADELRRRVRRRRRVGDVLALDESAEVAVADGSGVVDVASLIEGLGDDRRTAFVLTQLLGLPYDEAARVCGVPVGTIRSRVARARADLLAAASVDDEATS
jgi:RNA polymerase sigma-70 factor (ECF subfamily)